MNIAEVELERALSQLRLEGIPGILENTAPATSNPPVEHCGKLLGDTAAVSSMLARLHHGHISNCGRTSRRTKAPAE
jgi:hypothetical protein